MSVIYSLSSAPIPLWLPKGNDCREVIRELWVVLPLFRERASVLGGRIEGFVGDCLNGMYTSVYSMSRVVPARLPVELLRGVNALVKSGRYANRSEVIKEATRLLISSGGLPPPSALAEIAARLVSALVAWSSLGVESVTLYGSVARGEVGSQSDIDILVVVDRGEPWKTRRSLYDLIYPVIAALGIDISLMVISGENWLEMLGNGDPFALNVLKEGRPLWGQLTSPA